MPDFDVVADVSETLRVVVSEGLGSLMPPPAPAAEVVDLLRPVQSSSTAKVTIFLYEIVEDPSARNRATVRRQAGSEVELRHPPMALLLRYLFTPWSGDWQTDQKILGRVLQIFHDDSIISGPQLQGGLAGTSEAIKMSLAPISLEDRTRVWYSVQQPYRLSLTFEARVVNLDSTEARRVRPVRRASSRRAEAKP